MKIKNIISAVLMGVILFSTPIHADIQQASIKGIKLSIQCQQENKKIQKLYTPEQFQQSGLINWNGWTWSYYTLNMFPGSSYTPIPDKHVNQDGYVSDIEGYICLASVDLPQGTIIQTPFGYMGKVYDTGCPSGWLDVYTNF